MDKAYEIALVDCYVIIEKQNDVAPGRTRRDQACVN
jgi:hypothetical protein